jgi:hypothetical protein
MPCGDRRRSSVGARLGERGPQGLESGRQLVNGCQDIAVRWFWLTNRRRAIYRRELGQAADWLRCGGWRGLRREIGLAHLTAGDFLSFKLRWLAGACRFATKASMAGAELVEVDSAIGPSSVAEVVASAAILMPRLRIASRIFAAAADMHVTAFRASQGFLDDGAARLV